MKRARLLLVAILTLAATALWIAAAPAAPAPASGFGTEVQIEPSVKAPSSCSIHLKLTALGTGEVIAAPNLLVAADQTAEAGPTCPMAAPRRLRASRRRRPRRHDWSHSRKAIKSLQPQRKVSVP